MIGVVFDTVVFVRALLNRRSYWARLVFEHSDDYQLYVSLPIMREVLEVTRRPELTTRFTTLQGRDVSAVIGILETASAVEIDEATFPRVCRDPKDDKFLATAQAASVAFLVSEDNDLLDLGQYEGIRIVDAATFLDILNTP